MYRSYYPILKMIVGAYLAIQLAYLLKLDYPITAGVIVLLTIQPSKKQSIQIGIKRFFLALIGICISMLLVIVLNYQLIIFFLALLMLILIAFLFHLEEGIVVSSVLMSHIFIESDYHFGLNSIYLLIIGIMIGVCINLFMPNSKETIDQEMKKIDCMLRKVIENLSKKVEIQYSNIETTLTSTIELIKHEEANQLFNHSSKRLLYTVMRKEQLEFVKEIEIDLKQVVTTQYLNDILSYLSVLSTRIGEENMAERSLMDLEVMRSKFKLEPLPLSRSEFEERAILYHILFDIERFLLLKVQFHQMND